MRCAHCNCITGTGEVCSHVAASTGEVCTHVTVGTGKVCTHVTAGTGEVCTHIAVVLFFLKYLLGFGACILPGKLVYQTMSFN